MAMQLPFIRRGRDLLNARFDQFIARRMPEAASSQTLDTRSIYVLPTGYGVFFALMLYCMLMGSINYSNSMGFLLTFLLAGIALVGMLYTYRNLASLKVHAGRNKAVFAGDMAEFKLHVQTSYEHSAFNIMLGTKRRQGQLGDVPGHDMQHYTIKVATQQRGLQALGRIRISTEFPLGLFHVWSWLAIESHVLVYPKPSGVQSTPPPSLHSQGEQYTAPSGHDDFAGIRNYQPSDSLGHIAWKALAKEQDLLTKQFSGLAGTELWLDWEQLSGLSTEQRLSQLCQWVLDLHKQRQSYGLRLPGLIIPPNSGEQHKHICLEKLALFKLA